MSRINDDLDAPFPEAPPRPLALRTLLSTIGVWTDATAVIRGRGGVGNY
jgi:hypothetical protein